MGKCITLYFYALHFRYVHIICSVVVKKYYGLI